MNANALTTTGAPALDFEASPSILGESSIRVPVSGKIRVGIMALTRDGAALPNAQAIYDKGVADGLSWDAIEAEIKRTNPGFSKSPLAPKNAPYFTVFSHDFGMPEVADIIMEKYGEDRGDGIKRLYRIPLVFGLDLMEQVLPHQFAAWSRNERLYWSEYGVDGIRHCMTHEAVPVDQHSKRASKRFGGRKSVLRKDNNGVCNPDVCPQFQKGECKLSGQLVAYVPGVPGVGMVAIPTTSIYSLTRIRDKLVIVYQLRGRISGTNNGQPIFWLTKREEEVSMIDPATGLAKKVKQYLVVLEEDVDMTKVLASREAPALIHSGATAAAALAAPTPAAAEPVAAQAAPVAPAAAPAPEAPKPRTADEIRTDIERHLTAARVKKATFKKYADQQYPQGWREDVEALSKLLDAAIALKEDEAVRAKVLAFEVEDKL